MGLPALPHRAGGRDQNLLVHVRDAFSSAAEGRHLRPPRQPQAGGHRGGADQPGLQAGLCAPHRCAPRTLRLHFFHPTDTHVKPHPRHIRSPELLCMPGVKIERWRGRQEAAQCHRCQQFCHSSQTCHRRQAYVRCGEEHPAGQCPRPRRSTSCEQRVVPWLAS